MASGMKTSGMLAIWLPPSSLKELVQCSVGQPQEAAPPSPPTPSPFTHLACLPGLACCQELQSPNDLSCWSGKQVTLANFLLRVHVFHTFAGRHGINSQLLWLTSRRLRSTTLSPGNHQRVHMEGCGTLVLTLPYKALCAVWNRDGDGSTPHSLPLATRVSRQRRGAHACAASGGSG